MLSAMSFPDGPLTGAPLSQDGGGVSLVGSGNGSQPPLPGAGKYRVDTTAAPNNIVNLPPIESIPGGSELTIYNTTGADVLVVNASGTEQIDGSGAPGTLSIPIGESRTFTSDRGKTSPLVIGASWWSQGA
jgi:hypothetical protein